MKRHFTLPLALALSLCAATISCDKAPKAEAPKTETSTTTTAEAVQPMDYALFTQAVATVTNGNITYINKAPIVIDFYATWCPPCKQLKPILETVATAYAGKVAVYKVDVDQEPDLAALYNIQSIPTLLYVSADGKAEVIPGFADGEQLRQQFDKLAGSAPTDTTATDGTSTRPATL